MMPLPGPLSQQKHYTARHGTQSRRDDLLFTNMIDLPFTLYYLCLEAEWYFSLDHFSVLVLWLNWFCANKWRVSVSPSQLKNECWRWIKSLQQEAVLLLSTCAATTNTIHVSLYVTNKEFLLNVECACENAKFYRSAHEAKAFLLFFLKYFVFCFI